MKSAIALLLFCLLASGAFAGPILQTIVTDLPGGAQRFDYYVTAPGDAGYFLFTLGVAPELTGSLSTTEPAGWFALTPPGGGISWLSIDPIYDIYPSSTGNFSVTGAAQVGFVPYTLDLFDPISGLAFDFVEGEVLGPVFRQPDTEVPGGGGGPPPDPDPGTGGNGGDPLDPDPGTGGNGGDPLDPGPSTPAEIPEPSALLLFASGALLLALRRRRRQMV